MRRSFVPVIAILTLVLSLVAASPARAGGGPDKVFAGKILTSDKKFPTSAKSAGAYTAALRKQSKNQFWEDKTKQTWKIHFAAFFKKQVYATSIMEATARESSPSRRRRTGCRARPPLRPGR